ncbi:MAG: hypothetical protein LUH41_02050 [Clostridiales bacterium]|nr:hypothetical protein [Clostridiales bacterium]
MKIADYAVTIQEPVACVKQGRTVLLKLCVALLCVVGAVVVVGLIWAAAAGVDVGDLPWAPRLALAALAIAGAAGIYQSVREEKVPVKLSFYKDRLTITDEGRPSLWREGAQPRTVEIPYDQVKSCFFSPRRMKVVFQMKTYTVTWGERTKQKGGTAELSTLGAPDTDFADLIQKHSPLKVSQRN